MKTEALKLHPTTRNSPDTVAAFAVNTTRNLRLAADGEKPPLRSSQVFFSSPTLSH